MADLFISSSLIKSLFNHNNLREDICFKKIHAQFFEKVRSIPSEPQSYGLYFETKALGSGARNSKLEDLTRKASGEKTAVQQRLDDQVEKLKLGLIEYFIQIVPEVNTQISLFKRIDESVIIQATYDIFPTPIYYRSEILPIAAVDLKVTKDMDNDFGEYCWGRPEDMDHTQLVLQNYILREFDITLNQRLSPEAFRRGLIRNEMLDRFNDVPVFYWVFEYGLKMRNQLIKVNIDPLKLSDLKEVIRKVSVLCWEQDNRLGWPAIPEYNNCKLCPLSYMNGGLCREAKIIKEV